MAASLTALSVLALEPFYGGSHRAFLDGWIEHSRHRFEVLGLPARQWKWRMRSGPLAAVAELEGLAAEAFDVLFCSDMLDLACFRGIAPAPFRDLPAVIYFHENQFTYPVRPRGELEVGRDQDETRERDAHFGLTNLTSALAAREVWWNSAFHRDDFVAAAARFVGRMPKPRPGGLEHGLLERSRVEYPGVSLPPTEIEAEVHAAGTSAGGPIEILWAARWEFDKNPAAFFLALRELRRRGVDFRVSVLGQSFPQVPPVFDEARKEFEGCIRHWGFQASRDDYWRCLLGASVFVSTADHEFFGIAVVEAMAAGCLPVLPARLSYPELVEGLPGAPGSYLYPVPEGPPNDVALARVLADHLEMVAAERRWEKEEPSIRAAVRRRFAWRERASRMDERLLELLDSPP